MYAVWFEVSDLYRPRVRFGARDLYRPRVPKSDPATNADQGLGPEAEGFHVPQTNVCVPQRF